MAETFSFDVNYIPGIRQAILGAVQSVADDMAENKNNDQARKITIEVVFKPTPEGTKIEGVVKTKLAQPGNIAGGTLWGVMENGTIRLEAPKQEAISFAEGGQ